MDRNSIVEIFANMNFKVMFITFYEEGYEIVIKSEEEVNFDTVSDIKINGFSVVGINKRNLMFRILIVPISLEEMTDYIWRYVEKFGDKDEKLIDILGDAVCALERMIDSIPNEQLEPKKTALNNFEKFTSQIF